MTDEAFKEFQRQFELFLNQQRADAEAVRTIVQSLLVSMFGAHPNGTVLLNNLRSNVLTTLDRHSLSEAPDPSITRLRQATKTRAERFFDELREVFPGLDSSK